MLDILVLLLHNLVSWQHDEVLFVYECIKKIDECPGAVQICREEIT